MLSPAGAPEAVLPDLIAIEDVKRKALRFAKQPAVVAAPGVTVDLAALVSLPGVRACAVLFELLVLDELDLLSLPPPQAIAITVLPVRAIANQREVRFMRGAPHV